VPFGQKAVRLEKLNEPQHVSSPETRRAASTRSVSCCEEGCRRVEPLASTRELVDAPDSPTCTDARLSSRTTSKRSTSRTCAMADRQRSPGRSLSSSPPACSEALAQYMTGQRLIPSDFLDPALGPTYVCQARPLRSGATRADPLALSDQSIQTTQRISDPRSISAPRPATGLASVCTRGMGSIGQTQPPAAHRVLEPPA